MDCVDSYGKNSNKNAAIGCKQIGHCQEVPYFLAADQIVLIILMVKPSSDTIL